MSDWFDEAPIVLVEPSKMELNHRWLAKKQQAIFEQASRVTEDTLLFRDLDPAADAPPEKWVSELGTDEAWKRFRVARSAWMSAKEAPVGIKVAKELVIGISKALGDSAQAPRIINMQKVTVHTGPAPEFPIIEVEQ